MYFTIHDQPALWRFRAEFNTIHCFKLSKVKIFFLPFPSKIIFLRKLVTGSSSPHQRNHDTSNVPTKFSISATDRDVGDTVTYRLVHDGNGALQIDSLTGEITATVDSQQPVDIR